MYWQGKPYGTAFLVDDSGLFVTCFHVVEPAFSPASNAEELFKFRFIATGEEFKLQLTDRYSKAQDIAVLEVHKDAGNQSAPLTARAAELNHSKHAHQGMRFYSLGYGTFSDKDFTPNFVSNAGTILGSTGSEGVNWLQLSCDLDLAGLSGAPIIIEQLKNRVVGLYTGFYETLRPNESGYSRAARAEWLGELIDTITIYKTPLISPSISPLLIQKPSSYIPELPDEVIGRDQLVLEIVDKLKPGTRLILHGEGGLGKSTVAKMVAKAVAEQAIVILVENGSEDRDALLKGLMRLFGVDYTAAIDRAPDTTSKVDLFRQVLLNSPKPIESSDEDASKKVGLLIFDNVESETALDLLVDIMPPEIPLLVTTRIIFLSPGRNLERIRIEPPDDALAIKLLRFYAGNPNWDEEAKKVAVELCKMLHNNPLLIRRVGAMMLDDGPPQKIKQSLGKEAIVLMRASIIDLSLTRLKQAYPRSYDAFFAFGSLFTRSVTAELMSLCLKENTADV